MATEFPVIPFIDPSELYRPEKTLKKGREIFRDYSDDSNDPIKKRVKETYFELHTNQTVEFVRNKIDYWTKFDKAEMTVMEALVHLNNLVDHADPDLDVPNIVHAFQTAERLREDYPQLDWLQLTGLIHDVGKIMCLYGEEQWAVVGDTFPVGCAVAPSVVYSDQSFTLNPDMKNPLYNTRLGIYKENCGLDKVIMSWGHDEYMYRVLKNSPTCRLPQASYYIIRFHSFYPWHTGEDYMYLCSKNDLELLPWIKLFNQYDLYSKADHIPDVETLMPYYQSIIDKYIPGKLQW